MSRTEETTTNDQSSRQRPEVLQRILDTHRPVLQMPVARVAGVGVPLAAATGTDQGGNVSVRDVITTLAENWPGHWLGFAATSAAGAGVGYFYLKQKWGPLSGPTASKKAGDRVGFASPVELRNNLSDRALRKRAAVLRPSLAEVGRRAFNPHDLGLHLGTDLLYKRGLYITCEDTLLMIAPPRSGKTGQMGNAVIDAAGCCIVTSTRSDLYDHTAQLRREHNRPVVVFNADVAGVPNTMRWNLVDGCQDPEVAIRRAGFLLSASAAGESMENGSFWSSHSFRVLRSYLMAAALAGRDLMAVRAWVNNPTDREPLEVLAAFADRGVPEGWARDLQQTVNAPDRTRDSIYMTLTNTFEFLALPQVVDIVRPRPGEQRFDPADFIRARGTLYLMGRDRQYGSIAPLFSCLVGEVYTAAQQMADSAGGRMDPYVRLVLDEAAIICPLPLHQWTADAGGRNIQLLISVQSMSQLKERWGQWGAQTIWTNASKVVLGGLSVAGDLDDLSALCGEKDEETASSSTDSNDRTTRNVSVRRVRVMPPDQIRGLREGTGLFFHRALPPIRYAFTPVWDRPDLKALRKAERQAEKVERRAKKKGTFVAGPVLPPPMPARAPEVQPAQPGSIPAQPEAPAADSAQRWTA